MKIVCAPDSFKESLSAAQAADAMARGVRRALPDAEVVAVPLSDGGEGFVTAMAAGLGARLESLTVPDPLGRPVAARWARAGDLGVIEVAEAVGLHLLATDERDPRRASTAGVGLLVRAALDAGVRRLVVGLGGSATTDAGAGMLAALGVRFLGADGRELEPTPAGLERVESADLSGLDRRLAGVQVEAACDVDNPLCGPRGAAAVFGPQKGADATDVAFCDDVLARVARAVERQGAGAVRGPEVALRPGAGAAGGLGWALMAVLGATMRPGFEVVADALALPSAIAGADLVLSGEGSIDAQTLSGKAPAGVARTAAAAGVPVVLFGGRIAPDAAALLGAGVRALVPITPEGTDLPTALREAAVNLEGAVAAYLAGLGGHADR